MIDNLMKIMPSFFLALFISGAAYAACMPEEGSEMKLSPQKIYLPVVDESGGPLPGCLIRLPGHLVAYTGFDHLCRERTDTVETVRLSRLCCEMPPDSGKPACTARVKGVLGALHARGEGINIAPAKPGQRAVDDLLAQLSGSETSFYYPAAAGLAAYAAAPATRPYVMRRRGELRTLFRNGASLQQRGYAAHVLRQVKDASTDEMFGQILAVLELHAPEEDVTIPALLEAADYPDRMDSLVSLLFFYLREVPRSEEKRRDALFQTLEKLAPQLLPYLNGLLSYEYEWSERAGKDFPDREEMRKRVNRLACLISPEQTRAGSRAKLYSPQQDAKLLFTCPVP